MCRLFARHRHTIAPKTGFGNGIFGTFLHKKRCPTRRGFCSRNTKNPRHFPLPEKHSGQTREKTLDFASACWYNVLAKRAQRLWSGIEVVITALTRKHQGFMETFRPQTRMNTGFLISHYLSNPVFPSFFLPYFLKTSGTSRKVEVENKRKSCKIKLGHGELSEWSKVQHSKCCVPKGT